MDMHDGLFKAEAAVLNQATAIDGMRDEGEANVARFHDRLAHRNAAAATDAFLAEAAAWRAERDIAAAKEAFMAWEAFTAMEAAVSEQPDTAAFVAGFAALEEAHPAELSDAAIFRALRAWNGHVGHSSDAMRAAIAAALS